MLLGWMDYCGVGARMRMSGVASRDSHRERERQRTKRQIEVNFCILGKPMNGEFHQELP